MRRFVDPPSAAPIATTVGRSAFALPEMATTSSSMRLRVLASLTSVKPTRLGRPPRVRREAQRHVERLVVDPP